MNRLRCFWPAAGFIVLLAAIAYPADGIGDGREDYIMGDVSTLAVDFDLQIEVLSPTGDKYGPGTPEVDKVCIFRIDRSDIGAGTGQSGLYGITFFLDNSFSGLYQSRELPFSLKRNFRGMKDGEYAITFVVKDESGQLGKGSVEIRVKH